MDASSLPQSTERLDALSSLRFFAAFAVLMLHFLPFLTLPPLLAALAQEGRAGVSFFFVLSGFILYYTYHARFAEDLDRTALKRFFQARFARVYPLHALTLVAITPIVLFQLRDPHLAVERYGAQVLKPLHVAASWVTNLAMVNIYVPLVGGGTFTYAFLWNAPAWSIACEVVFYLIFPFFTALVLTRFTTGKHLWALLLGLYAVEVVLVMGASLGVQQKVLVNFATYHLPVFRIWEFLIGAVVGKLFVMAHSGRPVAEDPGSRRVRAIALVAVTVAIADVALIPQWLKGDALSPLAGQVLAAGLNYAFYTPLFALLVYLVAVGHSRITAWLAWRPLVILGEASYSLYMIHWIAVTVLKHWKLQGVTLSEGAVWVVIGGVVLASLACYYGFEGPARRLLGPRLQTRNSAPSAPVGSIAPS